jgi:hypothetical protein
MLQRWKVSVYLCLADRGRNLAVMRLVKLCLRACQCFRSQPGLLAQLDALKTFIDDGGSVLVMLAEGGEAAMNTNINYLTEQ